MQVAALWFLAVILATLVALWLIGERGRPLRRSTWRIVRECGVWPFFSYRGMHGYFYARWPDRYIGLFLYHLLGRMGPRSKRWLANSYHGKVLTAENAKAIVTVNRKIPLRDLEQIIPYPMARDIVINGPPDIAVLECPCRLARPSPCHPTQVCVIVGQPFVDFTLEHHPTTSRRVSQAEALELLEAEHRRGHVQTAWFKDVCLGRFYAICNCCKCCCGGIEAMTRYGVPMMTSSGYVATVDPSCCEGCGRCEAICAFGAMRCNGTARVDASVCLGCGACQSQCEHGAVSLVRDLGKGIPLDVRVLAEA